MIRKKSILASYALIIPALAPLPAVAGFLEFPLRGCSDSSCTVNYDTHGAYTANAMNSVLDHSMAIGTNSFYPYGTTMTSRAGGDSVVKAFNGEMVSGALQSGDYRCVGGTINLRPDWNTSARMTNDSGCGSGYTSYDEHPGYDYKAVTGTPVYAAAGGKVISTICYVGNLGDTCKGWGALAINHGNGYFSQYLHMDTTIAVTAGQVITAGQQIGTVGNKCPTVGCALGAHLHFEVRSIGPKIGAEAYPIVDPYGWVGGGNDSLYSASLKPPQNLWK